MTVGTTERTLAAEDCRRLLRRNTGRRCRVAFNAHCLPEIAAANYEVDTDDSLLVAAGPWVQHAAGNVVAFEVDGEDDGHHWCVLVQGTAELGAGPQPAVRIRPGLVRGWVSV